MATKTLTVTFPTAPLLTDVHYVFVGIDGATVIARTTSGVTGSGHDFSVTLTWDPTKIGTFTWDDNAGNTVEIAIGVDAFSTIEEASEYFASRLYAQVWFSSAIYAQQQALNDATRILDRFCYIGLPIGQEHSWPRKGIYLELIPVDDTSVPSQILQAQFEIALALLKGYDPEREMRNASVISRGYSSVRIAYSPTLTQDYLRWGVPSGAAWNLMLCFLDMDPDVAVRLHRVS